VTEAASDPVRARPWRILAFAALALGLGVLVLLATLYGARRQIAREAVTGWLKSRGIASESSFSEVGPGRLVGRVRIGSPSAPDLTVDRVEVDYSLAGLITGGGVRVTAIRLVRPVLAARFQAGRFSAGALDPLIEEFRKQPPRARATSPRVEVDQGRLALATDYGLIRANVDALVDNAKLVRLDASSAPMRLATAGLQADLGTGALHVRTSGGRMTANLRAPIIQASLKGAVLRAGELTLDLSGDYPDLGRAQASAGQAAARLTAGEVRTASASAGPLRLDATSAWRWRRAGSDQIAGDLRLAGDLRQLAASDLRLATVAGSFAGGFSAGRATTVDLAGGAEARGGWGGLGPPAKGDSKEIAALKRGLRSFRASAQGVQFAVDASGPHMGLKGPARLLPDAGGAIRLTPAGAGWRLASDGGGLPRIVAAVRRFTVAEGVAVAVGDIRAALSIGPVQDGVYDASGALRIANGGAQFLASRCVDLKAARFDLGTNDAEKISGRFCPAGAPLLQVGRGGFSLDGRAEQVAAMVPFLQADVSDAAAQVRLTDTAGALSAKLSITEARVRAAAKSARFRPLIMRGEVTAARDLWTGDLAFRLPKGPEIAHAKLRHDGRAGEGQVQVGTGTLSFRPGGLQPTDLSPMAQSFGTAVDGQADFSGAFRWSPAAQTSGGELRLRGIDFKSPAGAVTDLAGAIRFTSLNPLIAPPGQVLKAAKVAAALPLTDVSVSFAVQEKAVVVARAEAGAGGGKLRIGDLAVPLEPDPPIRGALDVDGVQLHDLVEASPFGDRVDLDAKVSGRIPFALQGGTVHIAEGDLHAVAPGRLSIRRAALTSVTAQGSIKPPAGAAAPVANTDTFTDFAYQAMENLAFSKLDAQVNTLPNGRLSVLFHVVGYHDPPKHQEITLSWWDLIRRKFLGKQLPLPSGTGVNLTLDTTLNLDDLLKDYADFERLKGSGQVQR